MANRGYSETDGRFDMSGGDHDTEDFKRYVPGQVESIAGRTSVGEQIARGGWTRSDTPSCDDPTVTLKAHKYQGGSADGGDRAAYPGVPTPKSGTTY